MDKWVIKIEGQGYASKQYFRNGMSGRPIVKSRALALELTTEECHQGTGGPLTSVLREMRYRDVKLSKVEVCAADHRENLLHLTGWWDLFSTFK